MKSLYLPKDMWALEKPSIESVGSKAYNLFCLSELGFNVPDFFVLSVDCVASLKSSKTLSSFSCYEEVIKRKRKLDSEYVAVRSSSLCEDGLLESWAGHFTTHLSINEEKLFGAIIDCSCSAGKKEISYYQEYRNIESSNFEKIGIIVQKMIYPEISGVLFTKHPVTGDDSVLYGELCHGLCEKLVSGVITPDTILVSKNEVSIQKTSSLITEKQILELTRIALQIENSFGFCCDIEWAIENNIIWILQVRPITTS